MSVNTSIHIDEAEQKLNIVTTQDEAPILDTLHDMRESGYTGTSDMRFAGFLPEILVQKYLQEKGITLREFMLDDMHIVRILNDPEYKNLRVWGGRL
jgi:hypothetical protein